MPNCPLPVGFTVCLSFNTQIIETDRSDESKKPLKRSKLLGRRWQECSNIIASIFPRFY